MWIVFFIRVPGNRTFILSRPNRPSSKTVERSHDTRLSDQDGAFALVIGVYELDLFRAVSAGEGRRAAAENTGPCTLPLRTVSLGKRSTVLYIAMTSKSRRSSLAANSPLLSSQDDILSGHSDSNLSQSSM